MSSPRRAAGGGVAYVQKRLLKMWQFKWVIPSKHAVTRFFLGTHSTRRDCQEERRTAMKLYVRIQIRYRSAALAR